MLSPGFKSVVTGASPVSGRAFCHLCTELEHCLLCVCMGSWEQIQSKAWNDSSAQLFLTAEEVLLTL